MRITGRVPESSLLRSDNGWFSISHSTPRQSAAIAYGRSNSVLVSDGVRTYDFTNPLCQALEARPRFQIASEPARVAAVISRPGMAQLQLRRRCRREQQS
jgi:hypothetical protein